MKVPTVLSATLMTALAACTTQDGALIHVTFDAGSVDHVEFFFVRARPDIPLDLSPLLSSPAKPTVYQRDYYPADSVAIAAGVNEYDYLVPSNAAPAAEGLFVVGYRERVPVQIAQVATLRVSSERVNRYSAALAPDAANLEAFGPKPFTCVTWRHGDAIDAITLAGDNDCDGRARTDEPTCDTQVADPQAPDQEMCDSIDSGSDCKMFAEPVRRLCKTLNFSNNNCLLGTGYGCSETVGARTELPCDGPPPESTSRSTTDICVDALTCKAPLSPPFDLATATPDFDCTVFVKDDNAKGCNKFQFTAIPRSMPIACPDPDYFDDGFVKLQKVGDQGGCKYDGEVLDRAPGQTAKNIAVMYPTPNGLRRLTVFRLLFQSVSSCDSNSTAVTCHVHNDSSANGPLKQACN